MSSTPVRPRRRLGPALLLSLLASPLLALSGAPGAQAAEAPRPPPATAGSGPVTSLPATAQPTSG